MTKKFRSEKGLTTGIIFFSVIAISLLPLLFGYLETGKDPLIFLPVLFPIALLLWLWLYTYYKIDEKYVYYRSGPFFGKIDILKINQIHVNKTLLVGFRPALAFKGLIIKYNKWDEIYFSPENKNAFLEELLKIKPTIVITQSEE